MICHSWSNRNPMSFTISLLSLPCCPIMAAARASLRVIGKEINVGASILASDSRLIVQKRCLYNVERTVLFPSSRRLLTPPLIQGKYTLSQSRPNWIMGPAPKSGSAGKSESRICVCIDLYPQISRKIPYVGTATGVWAYAHATNFYRVLI